MDREAKVDQEGKAGPAAKVDREGRDREDREAPAGKADLVQAALEAGLAPADLVEVPVVDLAGRGEDLEAVKGDRAAEEVEGNVHNRRSAIDRTHQWCLRQTERGVNPSLVASGGGLPFRCDSSKQFCLVQMRFRESIRL